MAIDDIMSKGVKVTLDKERTIMYPMMGMAYLAEQYGSIIDAFEAFQGIMPHQPVAPVEGQESAPVAETRWKMDSNAIKTLTHFIVAGFLAEDEDITYKEVSRMLDMTNMGEVITAVSQALTNYMPKTKVGGNTPPKRPRK